MSKMLVSKTNEEIFKKIIDEKVDKNIWEKIQKVSVKLTVGIDEFTGSGAILGVEEGKGVVIVTAKHNLYFAYNNKFPDVFKWSPDISDKSIRDKLSNYFKENVIIHFTGSEGISQKAGIKYIFLVNPIGVKGYAWNYDVMILISEDPKLVKHAEEYKIYNDFGTIYNRLKDEKDILLKEDKYLERKIGNYFIQTGYGDVEDSFLEEKLTEKGKPIQVTTKYPVGDISSYKKGHFQYRVISYTNDKTETYKIEVNHEAMAVTDFWNFNDDDTNQFIEHQRGILLKGVSVFNTAASGDSGGPLFLISPQGKQQKLYLIGVHSGANINTSKKNEISGKGLPQNNIVTSLKDVYSRIIGL